MSAVVTPAPPSAGPPTPPASTPPASGPPASGPPASAPPAHRTLLGFVATRRVVEVILMLILGVGSGLLFFGSSFGLNMVHSQLKAQDISFPAKGTTALNTAEFPGLQRYAGQSVDTGDKAKAYANQFIAVHLKAIDKGQTYSQVSAASIADPTNATLTADVATLFKGQTLRGLLLYAWGWSVVSTLALYAAIAALIGFVIMLAVTVGDFVADPRIAARHISNA
jgi:hypothetical protein